MAGSREVLVKILGDASSAQKAFKTIGDEGDKTGSKLKEVGEKIQKGMVPVGAALAGVGAGLLALSRPAAQAERVLKQTIENSGHSFADFEERVDAAIDTQERFGHNSAEVQTALSNLTLRLGDPKKALDNLALAADIASLKHISLAEASTVVASAVNGSAKVFKTFGIVLDDSKPKAEAVADAVQKLRDKVGGFASGEAATFEGKIEGIRTKLENFAATAGEKAGTAIAGFGTALATVGGAADGLEAVTNIIDKLPGKTENFAKALGGIGLAAGGMYAAHRGLTALNDALDRARRGTENIDAVEASLVKLVKGTADLANVLSAGRIKGGVDALLGDLERLRSDTSVFSEAAANDFKKAINDIDKGLADLVTDGKAEQAAAAFKALNAQMNLTPKEKARFFDDYGGAVETAGHKAVVAAAEVDTNTLAIDKNAAANDKLADSIDKMLTAQISTINSSVGLESAMERVSDSATDVAEKTKELAEVQKNHKAGSAEVTTATEALSDAQNSQKEAAIAAAGAAVRLAQDQAAASGPPLTAAQSNEIFKTKLQELAAQIGGPTGTALANLATGIHNIPGQKTVSVEVTGVDWALVQLHNLQVAAERAAGVTVNIRQGRANADGGIVQFANGGENHVAQVAPGTMRLWAEPETGGEAYIPLASAKRGRSVAVLKDVAARFGMAVVPQANGGVMGASVVAAGGMVVHHHWHFDHYVGAKEDIVRVVEQDAMRKARNGDPFWSALLGN